MPPGLIGELEPIDDDIPIPCIGGLAWERLELEAPPKEWPKEPEKGEDCEGEGDGGEGPPRALLPLG